MPCDDSQTRQIRIHGFYLCRPDDGTLLPLRRPGKDAGTWRVPLLMFSHSVDRLRKFFCCRMSDARICYSWDAAEKRSSVDSIVLQKFARVNYSAGKVSTLVLDSVLSLNFQYVSIPF